MEPTTAPSLIEPGVRSFLGSALKECRRFKERHMTVIFNISMAAVFVVIFSGIMLWRYKGRLTPSERAAQQQRKYEYVISKIHQLAYVQNAQKQNTFTQLPMFSSS